jgi:hypothetical protein
MITPAIVVLSRRELEDHRVTKKRSGEVGTQETSTH